MNILIVGSKGFIGSTCMNYFKHKGYHITGCDVVVDYGASDYFQIDDQETDFREVFKKQIYDFCINCSGAASVPDSFDRPYRDYALNVINVYKILSAIKEYQPRIAFINLSSAAVYGNSFQLPIKEDDLLKPISPYGWHKLQAEEICRELNQFFQLRTCSLRIFSAYGNGLKKQIFWDLYRKVVSSHSDDIELFGTGKESRDFIHAIDVARAIEVVMLKGSFSGEVYNVANGEEVLIEDAVKIFLDQIQFKGGVRFSTSERVGDPINWKADIHKISSLGYTKSIDLNSGLSEYVQWLKTVE